MASAGAGSPDSTGASEPEALLLGLYPRTDPQTKTDFEAWRKAKRR